MTDPAAYSVEGAAAAYGVSEVTIRREIKAERLAVRYFGRKPLIPATSLAAWFKQLPAERPAQKN